MAMICGSSKAIMKEISMLRFLLITRDMVITSTWLSVCEIAYDCLCENGFYQEGKTCYWGTDD